jgi:hypothetical protein
MAHYPQSAAGLGAITYPAGPGPLGVTVTASGSTNTKGLYAELTGSSAFACNKVRVVVQFPGDSAAGGYKFLLDIATGAALSEVVVVPNLMIDGQVITGSTLLCFAEFWIPLAIPAGTRISARCQCSVGSKTLSVMISLYAAGDSPGISTFTAYGINTGDSSGAQVDPGGSANTKGGYTELTASSSAVTQFLMLGVAMAGNTGPSTGRWYFDIATGAALSEVVLIPDIPVQIGGASPQFALLPHSHSFLTYIPAGTRIAVRASCSINDATDRLLDVALLSGTAPAEASGSEHSHVFAG